MALILNIETSGRICSLASSRDGYVLAEKRSEEGRSHASVSGPFVDELLSMIEHNGDRLEAVAVSAGPGSYTGLRIGVSLAKGICYALDIPLIAVSTLSLLAGMASHLITSLPVPVLVRPVLDARRMEVYTALYDEKGNCLEQAHPLVVSKNSFDQELEAGSVLFIGDAVGKLKEVIHSSHAFFEEREPLARDMVPLAEQAFARHQLVDVAYFEPHYLKEFTPTVRKPLFATH